MGNNGYVTVEEVKVKTLIRVRNTGEGHLRLYFSNVRSVDTYDTDSWGDNSVIAHTDAEGNVTQLEVLFVGEVDRMEHALEFAKRLDLDISPLFSTYRGPLAA